MSDGPDLIRQNVREHYTHIAEGSGGCCGPDTCSCNGYSDAELALIPSEAVAIGLGCGNPTALASLETGEVVLDLGSGGGLDCFLAGKKVGLSTLSIAEAIVEGRKGYVIKTRLEIEQSSSDKIAVSTECRTTCDFRHQELLWEHRASRNGVESVSKMKGTISRGAARIERLAVEQDAGRGPRLAARDLLGGRLSLCRSRPRPRATPWRHRHPAPPCVPQQWARERHPQEAKT